MVIHVPSGFLPHRHVLALEGKPRLTYGSLCSSDLPRVCLEFPSSATPDLPDAVEMLCGTSGKTNPWPKCHSCYSLMFSLPVHRGQLRALGWCSGRHLWLPCGLCAQRCQTAAQLHRGSLHGSGNPGQHPGLGCGCSSPHREQQAQLSARILLGIGSEKLREKRKQFLALSTAPVVLHTGNVLWRLITQSDLFTGHQWRLF